MAAVGQYPIDISDQVSVQSISASSLAHLINYFGSLDGKDGTQQKYMLNDDVTKEEDLSLPEEYVNFTKRQKLDELQGFSSQPLPKAKPKGLSFEELDAKPMLKAVNGDKPHWLKRAFSSRFSTWAYDRNSQAKSEGSPLATSPKVLEEFPKIRIPGLDSTSPSFNTKESESKKRAATLPRLSLVKEGGSPNFRPSRSRSLAGRGLTSLFVSSKTHVMPDDLMEKTVFLPYNHEPQPSDFPSIKDVEDISEGRAQYSTLPPQWHGYKHEDLKSSIEEFQPARTRWAEWKRARKGILMLKGKLKLSFRLGTKKSMGLKVRFFSPSGLPSAGKGNVVSTEDEVVDTMFSPFSESSSELKIYV